MKVVSKELLKFFTKMKNMELKRELLEKQNIQAKEEDK
jgi:hypothetical protein